MDKNRYCVIMAGGIGSRFWPISRNARPKQFLDILGTGKTFLQSTFERFCRIVPVENIMVVTSESYRNLVAEQLPLVPESNVLLEPYRRNTAPCIAYATYKIESINPDAVVVVAPSDHLILNEDIFIETIESAFEYAADNEVLLTLGIKPTRPETGYGYIQCNMSRFHNVNGNTAYSVKTFTEKPDLELARVLVESGEFLWNSGIFVWNVKTIMSELEAKLPDVASLFEKGRSHYYRESEHSFIADIYETCQSISIDYGVMEKTDKAWAFKASFGWSDLGTWDSLYIQSEKDGNGNMLKGENLMLSDVDGSIVLSEEKNKLVTVSGLHDFMVVNTEDVLMICPRDSKSFKAVITDLAISDKTKFQ